MKEKPIQRIKKIIEAYRLSVSAFEKRCNMSNNSIQVAIKRNANVKDETLINILEAFPDISPSWLLTGNGAMYKSDTSVVAEDPITFHGVDPQYVIQIQKDYIDKLKEEIRELKK
ncbi:hypothetical protein [Flavobacterium sp.]|uniref:hypothetical protein n=1 Tax=Flavobacterium sp. TaxID=239 RepID=UPI003B993DDF